MMYVHIQLYKYYITEVQFLILPASRNKHLNGSFSSELMNMPYIDIEVIWILDNSLVGVGFVDYSFLVNKA